MDDDSHVSGIAEWQYIGVDAEPPRGKKINLLTKGYVQVIGNYTDDGSFIAWAPLIKRNKAKEAQQKKLQELDPSDSYLIETINDFLVEVQTTPTVALHPITHQILGVSGFDGVLHTDQATLDAIFDAPPMLQVYPFTCKADLIIANPKSVVAIKM